MTKNRKIYAAYGMNTNHNEMAGRCKDSRFIGKAILPKHQLVFRHVADIGESTQDMVVALWSISANDELELDVLEGYPHLYEKKQVEVLMGDLKVDCMVYYMTSRDYIGYPSERYYNMLMDGYQDSGMNEMQVVNAVSDVTRFDVGI